MRYFALLFLITALSFSSCKSKFQRSLKNPDPKYKLEMAEAYYQKKDYYRALTLFEQVEDFYSGTPIYEKVLYNIAKSNYGLKYYAVAGFNFKNYFENFSSGEFAEESLYMTGFCSFMESQEPELDQTDTYKSIETIKMFVSVYPDSKYVPECNSMLDKLRAKLSFKDYKNAKLYFNIREYKSAIIALENVIKDYPEIAQKEEIDYLIVKSHFLLAENSVIEKQKERYKNTLNAYSDFVETYPEGNQYSGEVRMIKEKAEMAIKKLEQIKS